MFGSVRAASSTLDVLELERAPSKLFKDDSFSIYETTLMKLKLGSQRKLEVEIGTGSDCASVETREDALRSPSRDQISMDNGFSSTSRNISGCSQSKFISKEDETRNQSSSSSGNLSGSSQSTSTNKRNAGRNASVMYLFSKYKSSSGQAKEEVMLTDDNSSIEVSVSESCSGGSMNFEFQEL